ncbi:trimeric LpxA-like protein [Podospora aff. communis PSN243]|uniref:Trimeric LpxA-like protein n=1 Tax=Podospora aff. communis PSN243 TaxID=3040156 RepID=A0AAV9GHA2_9PEZI|nr:trimeric LpxA-like protein [Podospora aff. communis PSN243]
MDLPEEADAVHAAAGVAFPAGNDDFRAARDRCAQACRRFNETPEDSPGELRSSRFLDITRPARDRSEDLNAAITHDMTFRNPALKAQTPFVKPPFYVDYGLRVRIGGSTFVNRGCLIMDTPVADVIIGEKCNIGPNCTIVSVGHALRAEERSGKQNSIGKAIVIGDHVWLGANVTVLGGVTIGDGAVIGAGSVVTKNIPPATMAFGVPARVVQDLNSLPDGVVDYSATVNTLTEAMMYDRPLDRKDELELARLNRILNGIQQQKKEALLQQKTAGVRQSDRPLIQQQPDTPVRPYFSSAFSSAIIFFLVGCLAGMGFVLFCMLLGPTRYATTGLGPPPPLV